MMNAQNKESNPQIRNISDDETVPPCGFLVSSGQSTAAECDDSKIISLAEELGIDLHEHRVRQRKVERKNAIDLIHHPDFTIKEHSSLTSWSGGYEERNKLILKSVLDSRNKRSSSHQSHQSNNNNNQNDNIPSIIENSTGAWCKRSSSRQSQSSRHDLSSIVRKAWSSFSGGKSKGRKL